MPADWPALRHDNHLTARQPVAGNLRAAPIALTRTPVALGSASLIPFASKPGGAVDRALAGVDRGLQCYDLSGMLLWASHPPGINFQQVVTVEDVDGDGRVEIVAAVGRPEPPLGAMLLLDAASGRLRWRYDVEPMSYYWYPFVGHYLPQRAGKQMLVLEQGYPPDKRNGYIALFYFPAPGHPPVARWKYYFHQYTAMPALRTADLEADGVNEICVISHSRMWVLSPLTGAVKQFIKWDVAPANIRSYGLNEFRDLNGDGLPDFLCIADFAQHHEVLLNDHGRLKLAWVQAWDNSVTVSNVATNWPTPPVADVDGDGRLEVVLSMFNDERDPDWAIRVYDAATGALKARIPGRIAVRLADVDGDGRAEILADDCHDPTRTVISGAAMIRIVGGKAVEYRRVDGVRASAKIGSVNGREEFLVTSRDQTLRVEDALPPQPFTQPPAPSGPDLSRIKAAAGQLPPAPLVADLDRDRTPEIIQTYAGKTTAYHWTRSGGLKVVREFSPSDDAVAADVDGDGKLELIIGSADASRVPVVRAYRLDGTLAWESRIPPTTRHSLPYGRKVYMQAGRFTGSRGADVYCLFGTPVVRSLLLEGATGKVGWEKDEFPGLERYWGPTVNQAAAYDANGDGADDLVFTNPDYYCVANGRTGNMIRGPLFPPDIFHQPSQGLYTLPAILDQPGEPLVVLCAGHYFQAGMSLRAQPYWYKLPEVGEGITAAEGFARLSEDKWLMGFGRQDGDLECLDARSGRERWRLPIHASAGPVSTCDINGDGHDEFVFGDSHGYLWAVGDDNGRPVVVWRMRVGASVGQPVVADLDGDGRLEIIAATGDGALTVLGTRG
jgi:outer membrane protein assembly factor BamB